MFRLTLALILIIFLPPYIFGKVEEVDYHIKKESQLLVHGKANILNFTCILKNAFDLTPFKVKGERLEGKLHLKEGQIEVPVRNLDCGSKGMNKDMRNLLKGDEHPKIILDFLEVQTPKWEKSGRFFSSSALSKIKITLAGVAVIYPIHLNLVKLDEKNFLLSGSKKLKMTDFNIKPKKYLFGLVEINELIEIDFELFLVK